MACLARRRVAHDELARVLETIPSVEAADHLQPEMSPSGRHETEVLVLATPRGTVPKSVQARIVDSTLGIANVDPANNPDYLRVVVR